MSKIYLISDSHFNHTNICGPKLSKWKKGYRNFSSLEEMNETFFDAINSKVMKNDVLYHLGDFAFGDKKQIPALRERINCNTIHLIYGNHDEAIKSNRDFQRLFSTTQGYVDFRHKGVKVSMLHYPMYVWDEHGRGGVHFFGHCHGNLGPQTRKREDVGFDPHPEVLSLDDYIDLLKDREIELVDHHGADN